VMLLGTDDAPQAGDRKRGDFLESLHGLHRPGDSLDGRPSRDYSIEIGLVPRLTDELAEAKRNAMQVNLTDAETFNTWGTLGNPMVLEELEMYREDPDALTRVCQPVADSENPNASDL
jgi:hypothetical protein